jgi:hypothetical protein
MQTPTSGGMPSCSSAMNTKKSIHAHNSTNSRRFFRLLISHTVQLPPLIRASRKSKRRRCRDIRSAETVRRQLAALHSMRKGFCRQDSSCGRRRCGRCERRTTNDRGRTIRCCSWQAALDSEAVAVVVSRWIVIVLVLVLVLGCCRRRWRCRWPSGCHEEQAGRTANDRGRGRGRGRNGDAVAVDLPPFRSHSPSYCCASWARVRMRVSRTRKNIVTVAESASAIGMDHQMPGTPK